MSTTATPEHTTDSQRTKTGYRILVQSENGWTDRGTTDAPTAEQAIRKHIDRYGKTENQPVSGTFVAIPARSWKPITVKTETKTVVTLT